MERFQLVRNQAVDGSPHCERARVARCMGEVSERVLLRVDLNLLRGFA
jgi:hypothetical protein